MALKATTGNHRLPTEKRLFSHYGNIRFDLLIARDDF